MILTLALLACSMTASTSSLLPTLWPIVNSVALREWSGILASRAMLLLGKTAGCKPFCKLKNVTAPYSKLSPHDSLCQKSESVALEFHRFLQIIHSYCENSDPWLHIGF